MSTPIGGAPDDQAAPSGDVQRPLNPAGHDLDERSTFTSRPNIIETERLLDIEGLLQIARLIKEFKKDGRLNGGEERPKHAGNQRQPRPKG